MDDAAARPAERSTLVLTALAYVPALLSMATVGVVVPFIGVLARELGATGAQLGFAIALYSMPTAALATAGGGLIDRYGVRRSMLVAVAIGAAASLCASQVHSIWALYAAMLLAGVGFGGLCVSAPVLLIATLRDAARIRAMSFFSTYAPTGYAAGLLLGAAFVQTGAWRSAFQVHAALVAFAGLVMLRLLPTVAFAAPTARPRVRETLAQIAAVVREPRALRLGLAVALPNAVSYGTSLAAPSYLARAYGLTLATSSATVALAKIVAMVLGGLGMGYLLSRKVSTTALFTTMVVIGIAAQALVFVPVGGISVATAALIVWLFAFGGMAGGAMALLPTVVSHPSRTGGASGLVNQMISAASFAAPSTWLAMQDGPQFVALAAACLVTSLLALPKGAANPASTPAADDVRA